MAVKLLHLCLLLVLLCPSQAEREMCPSSATRCDECIQAGPECAWCAAPYSIVRCHTVEELQRERCHKSHIYHPQGEVQVVKNESSTEAANAKVAFLQPQEFSLRLRPGVSQSFSLTITMPTDQPATELTMDTSPVPQGVNITFSSRENGNPQVVQVDVEAARCPSEDDVSGGTQNRTGPWTVHINPRGFSQSVKLEITLQCQCECTRNREENSDSCSGRGDLTCGRCECRMPYIGHKCQTDVSLSSNEDACRSGPNAPVCSNRGTCVDGECECSKRDNPAEKYSGRYCECSNFECQRANNRLCGGHGRCSCGTCVCDPGWTSEDCSCSLDTAPCLAANQQLCNGRGVCECGSCKCTSPKFQGPTCEICPTCPGACAKHKECVECRAFGIGEQDRCDTDCGHLNLTMVETKMDLGEHEEEVTMWCKERDLDDCHFYYKLSIRSSEKWVTVARAKECPSSLPFFPLWLKGQFTQK